MTVKKGKITHAAAPHPPAARVPPSPGVRGEERGEGQPHGELLLELLSEEVPARMQRRAIGDLVSRLGERLLSHRISPSGGIRGYVTPRRLTVIASGIPEKLPREPDERRGPRVGAPRAAVDGFLRSVRLKSIEECEIRDTGRGKFYFAIIERGGRAAVEVLPDIIKSTLFEFPWPKSMRWPGALLRWVRPLTSVLCLYDGEILPLAIEGVPVGRTSRGHRFLSPGEFCVSSADEYLEKLQYAYVIFDQDRRRELIRTGLDGCAAELGLQVKPDQGLLDEVTGLAEFPVVLSGAIDPDFMALPPEVLQTAMRTHQKYFSCTNPDGASSPHFFFIADNLAEDGGKAIVTGNERVLRARLADARFFWDQDRKVPLASRVDALKERVYHARLGSVRDKVHRMELLADILVPDVPGSAVDRSNRAALLAKADLSTGMVGEFPELQGVMGQYYARHDGEDPRVAIAIAEHYKPQGPSDFCPKAPDSIVVALADKIDTLVAFFAISLPPTGSGDPFALRRAAQGVIRLILENRLRLPLRETFTAAAEIFYLQKQVSDWEDRVRVLCAELIAFVVDRLKVHLREQGTRHDLIAAAFTQMRMAEDDLVRLLARVRALDGFLGSEDGSSLLTAYRRAANIVRIEDRKDGVERSSDVDPSQLREAEEAALAVNLDNVGSLVGAPLENERFEEAMAGLARLRQPVDEFFDNVTVNVDDAKLRENRLRLLARIRDTMNRVADFSRIEG
jgi:glycyl-tRNA synthetase beta chain